MCSDAVSVTKNCWISITLESFIYNFLKGEAAITLRINAILKATPKLQLENKQHFFIFDDEILQAWILFVWYTECV